MKAYFSVMTLLALVMAAFINLMVDVDIKTNRKNIESYVMSRGQPKESAKFTEEYNYGYDYYIWPRVILGVTMYLWIGGIITLVYIASRKKRPPRVK